MQLPIYDPSCNCVPYFLEWWGLIIVTIILIIILGSILGRGKDGESIFIETSDRSDDRPAEELL